MTDGHHILPKAGVFPSLVRTGMQSYRMLLIPGVAALIAVDLLDVMLPLILKSGFDSLESGSGMSGVRNAALLYLGVSTLQAGLRYIYRRLLPDAALSSARDARDGIVNRVVHEPVLDAQKRSPGSSLTLVSSDADAVGVPLDLGFVMLMDAAIYLIFIPIAMLALEPSLSLCILIPLAAIPLVMQRGKKIIYQRSQATQAALSELTDQAHESLDGIETIKAYSQEQALQQPFAATVTSLQTRSIDLARTESTISAQLEFLASVSTLLLIVLGGYSLIEGQMTIGTFVALQRYIQQLIWPTQALSFWLGVAQRAKSSSDRLQAVLLAPHTERSRVADPSPPAAAVAVTVTDLSFRYPDSGRNVLSRLSFTVHEGETIAIVGPNGSGKSTLAWILAGLYPVPEGSVFLGQQDLATLSLNQIQERVSLATQSPFLFSGTVEENLAFENLSPVAVQHVISALFNQSQGNEMTDLERSLQDGGEGLSGGQRQRVGVARALLKQSPLLILDDPLSAIDGQTTRRILPLLRRACQERTTVLVSQRLALLSLADRILVLDNGSIIQDGTFSQLTAAPGGWFKHFYHQQHLLEEITALSVPPAGDVNQ